MTQETDYADPIRTLVRTAVASAPTPPTVDDSEDDRVYRSVSDLRDSRRSNWIRVGAIAASVAAFAGIATVNVRSGGARLPIPGSTSFEPLRGLPTHALPAIVPDEWELVDVVEAPGSPGTASRPATQLFRRASDGAAVWLFLDPGPDASTSTTASPPTTSAPTGASDGPDEVRYPGFSAELAGLSTADARTFLDRLTPVGTGSALAYATTDPGWTLEWSAPSVPEHTVAGDAFSVLTYRSSQGSTIVLDALKSVPGDDGWRFGVPTQRHGQSLFVVDQRRWGATGVHASRLLGQLAVSVSAFTTSDATVDAVLDLLAGLREVDQQTWDAAASSTLARFESVPVRSELTVGDVLVTHRVDAANDSICAGRPGQAPVACHPNQGFDSHLPNLAYSVDLVVGDTWVHAGVENPAPVDRTFVKATAGSGTITSRITSDGGEQLYAAVADLGVTRMSIDTAGGQPGSGNEFIRPVR